MAMAVRSRTAANQMSPASTAASESRSTTESRKAPRREVRPEALATAPSSMSGSPERRLTAPPISGWPVAMRAPAPRLPASPIAVRLLAVMPALARAWPAGSVTWRKVSRALDESTRTTCSGRGRLPGGAPMRDQGRLTLPTDPLNDDRLRQYAVVASPLPGGDTGDIEGGWLPVKSYPTDHVRNIVIVGHGGAGKTSLVEALCHATGATNRIGRVEDGTTVTDFEPEETRKHISVSLAVAPVEHDGFKINLLDAPGYADFIGDVRSALPAADAVLFVVSAVEGVETQTEVVWTMAEELGLPRAFFINKLDRDRASFSRCLDGIQAAFGKACPPLYLPIGEQLIEAIIQESEDEELMDRYLGGDEIAPTDLIGDLEQAVAAGRLFPVLAGSAIRNIGVTELLEVCTQAFPSPAERPEVEGRRADPDGPLTAYVFKTISDPYVGRMNLFRVI